MCTRFNLQDQEIGWKFGKCGLKSRRDHHAVKKINQNMGSD